MAILRIYKRKSADMDLSKLVEAVSESGLEEGLQKFYDKPLEKETKSIVAGPSFLQFLSKLFRIQISGETSYSLNIRVIANTICSLHQEHGMK
jgi:hypothetical protein